MLREGWVFAVLIFSSTLMSMFASHLQGQPLQWRPLCEPGSGGWLTSIAISPHDPHCVLMGGICWALRGAPIRVSDGTEPSTS